MGNDYFRWLNIIVISTLIAITYGTQVKKIKIKKLNGLEKISYAFIIIPLGPIGVSEGLPFIKEIPDIIQFFFRLF